MLLTSFLVLDLTPGAAVTDAQIKARYVALVKKNPPGTARFQAIVAAYEAIATERARLASYFATPKNDLDKALDDFVQACSTPPGPHTVGLRQLIDAVGGEPL